MSPEYQVSAVIPAYNSSGTICSAIDSVLAQTLPCREVVVVDDGSSDDVLDLVGNRYPSIRLLSQRNQGAAAARNAGVEATKAPLIAFLDADDVWHPRKIELQVQALTKNPNAVACSTRWVFISAGQESVNWPESPGVEMELHGLANVFSSPYLGTPTVMVRRSVFSALNGFNRSLATAEDLDLWLRLAERGPICRLNAELTGVRPLETGLSKRDERGDQRNLSIIDAFLTRNPDFARTHRSLVGRVKSDVFCRTGSGFLTKGDFSQARNLLFSAVREQTTNTRAWYLLAKSIGRTLMPVRR